MTELFFALCALTSLACGDINVEYYRVEFDTHAIAAVDIRGNYHILINPSIRRKGGSFKRRLLIHELSHLVVFSIDPSNNTHNKLFDDVCEDLSEKANVDPNDTCSSRSKISSHWMTNNNSHYRDD